MQFIVKKYFKYVFKIVIKYKTNSELHFAQF